MFSFSFIKEFTEVKEKILVKGLLLELLFLILLFILIGSFSLFSNRGFEVVFLEKSKLQEFFAKIVDNLPFLEFISMSFFLFIAPLILFFLPATVLFFLNPALFPFLNLSNNIPCFLIISITPIIKLFINFL